MHTADPKSLLGHYCSLVDSMKPGERLDVPLRDLRDIYTYEHNGADFTPPDRILGNIVGSAWTHAYEVIGDRVTFARFERSDKIRYQEPDRR